MATIVRPVAAGRCVDLDDIESIQAGNDFLVFFEYLLLDTQSLAIEPAGSAAVQAGRTRNIKPGMTLPQMALRFILNHPAVSTIIPGMRKLRHVEMNMAASDEGPLPADLQAKLRPHRWDRVPTAWSF